MRLRKRIFFGAALLVLTGLSAGTLAGCGLPDLPGPIGIPGIERSAVYDNGGGILPGTPGT